MTPTANAGLDYGGISGTEAVFRADINLPSSTANVSFRTDWGSIYTPTRMEVGGAATTTLPAGTSTVYFYYDPYCYPYDMATEGGWTLVIDGYDVGYTAYPSGIIGSGGGRTVMCI